MKEYLDIIKVCLIWVASKLLVITEALGEIAGSIGAIAAAIYAVYKLVILHRDNKKKSK
jgi:hypothetical protein